MNSIHRKAELSKATFDFFALLFRPSELINFRLIDNHGRVRNEYHKLESLPRILPNLRVGSYYAQEGMYFGVCPRPEAGRNRAADIQLARCLWADLDAVGVYEALDRVSAASRLPDGSEGLPRPSIGVNSGNGVHLYWLLDRDHAPREVRPYVEWVAKLVQGDSVADPCRVLRVPGSWNWKSAPPKLCTIFGMAAERRYALTAFKMPMPPEVNASKGSNTFNEGIHLSGEDREKLIKLIHCAHITPKGHRSEKCYGVVCEAVKMGLGPERLYDMIYDKSKFAEHDDSWFISMYEKVYKQHKGELL